MNKKYPDEFKQEAVRQVIEKGHSVPDVDKIIEAWQEIAAK